MFLRVITLAITVCLWSCTAKLEHEKKIYNDGEFKYAGMLLGDDVHYVYIDGKKSDLRNSIKIQNFCFEYVKEFNKENKKYPTTIWLLNKEYFSMDQIHDENRVAFVHFKCFNNKIYLHNISLYKDFHKNKPIKVKPIEKEYAVEQCT
jgi:hypothetical protein